MEGYNFLVIVGAAGIVFGGEAVVFGAKVLLALLTHLQQAHKVIIDAIVMMVATCSCIRILL